MLEELRSYRNLGTPEYFFELSNLLLNHPNVSWTSKRIGEHFFNRIIDGRKIFDGCIQLAILIGFIEISDNESLIVPKYLHDDLNKKNQFLEKFAELILIAISKDKMFYEIFSPQNLAYDLVNQSMKINNNAFGFKFSQLKQLLLDFKILISISNEIAQHYIISHAYINHFQNGLMAHIKRKVLSPEQLNAILEIQNQYGLEAEQFVLKYEKKRLKDSKEVIWVANYSVSEGYDIASFNSLDSLLHDRFIEVKSYSGNPAFYWSRNEVETSRIKGKSYYLYLVNRDCINLQDYSPTIIRNAFEEIFNDSNWIQSIDKYFISKAPE